MLVHLKVGKMSFGSTLKANVVLVDVTLTNSHVNSMLCMHCKTAAHIV